MRESVITKEIARRFLVVSGVGSGEVARIVEGLLFDLPVSDVLDDIFMAVDEVETEADAVERLTICALAENMIQNVDAHHGRLTDTGAAIMYQVRVAFDSIGISFLAWESARQLPAAPTATEGE